jgi:hypothetical protein
MTVNRLLLMACMCALSACVVSNETNAGSRARAPLPSGPSSVTVHLTEYRFDSDLSSMPAGRAVFQARNVGTVDHQLVLARLPDDLQPLAAQLRSSTQRAIAELVYQFGFRPGEGTVFAADLQPGRYGLICFVRDVDGTSHAMRGMNAELTVR